MRSAYHRGVRNQSVVSRFIQIHPLARLFLALALTGALEYYAVVSEVHLLAHYTPPLFSSVVAILLVVVAVVNLGVLLRSPMTLTTTTWGAPPITVASMMFMMLFAVLSLSSLSSRYGGSGIAIPAALQVMGKASAAGVSLILGVLSVRRYLLTRRAFAEARKG